MGPSNGSSVTLGPVSNPTSILLSETNDRLVGGKSTASVVNSKLRFSEGEVTGNTSRDLAVDFQSYMPPAPEIFRDPNKGKDKVTKPTIRFETPSARESSGSATYMHSNTEETYSHGVKKKRPKSYVPPIFDVNQDPHSGVREPSYIRMPSSPGMTSADTHVHSSSYELRPISGFSSWGANVISNLEADTRRSAGRERVRDEPPNVGPSVMDASEPRRPRAAKQRDQSQHTFVDWDSDSSRGSRSETPLSPNCKRSVERAANTAAFAERRGTATTVRPSLQSIVPTRVIKPVSARARSGTTSSDTSSVIATLNPPSIRPIATINNNGESQSE